MFNVLSRIGEKLNEENILWGVGASILLNKFGLIDKSNDIDIIIDVKDIERADYILRSMGEKEKWEEASTYATKYFYEYNICGVEVDVMSGFAINHKEGTYEYVFDEDSVLEFENINGVKIPFTSLEDWFVIYQLIPNREAKVNMIENYIIKNGIKNNYLLERSLKGNLPKEVVEKINWLLIGKSDYL